MSCEATMSVVTPSDTEMLDFFEKNETCFLHLGKVWYARKAHGMPYHKRNNLRDAITLVMQLQNNNVKV